MEEIELSQEKACELLKNDFLNFIKQLEKLDFIYNFSNEYYKEGHYEYKQGFEFVTLPPKDNENLYGNALHSLIKNVNEQFKNKTIANIDIYRFTEGKWTSGDKNYHIGFSVYVLSDIDTQIKL